MSATHINDTNFQQSVLNNEGPVLVDFWAPWCGPCRAMGGVVDELASELGGHATVVKVNVDEAPEAARQFDVHSIPSFVLVDNGKERERVTGVVSKARLLDLVNSKAS